MRGAAARVRAAPTRAARRRLHDDRLALRAAAAGGDAARPGPGRPARTRTPTSSSSELASAVSPRVLEAPARLDEVRRELDLYFEGKLDRLRPAARLAAEPRLPPPGPAGDRPHPLRQDPQLHRDRRAAPATSARCAPPAPPAARNPIPIVVPCHRVLRTGGALGGYGGGLPMKQALLRARGRRCDDKSSST